MHNYRDDIYPLQIVIEGDLIQGITYEIHKEVGSLAVFDIIEVNSKRPDWMGILKDYLNPKTNAVLVNANAEDAVEVGNCHVAVYRDVASCVDRAYAIAKGEEGEPVVAA